MPKPASLKRAIDLDYPRDKYGNLKFAEGEMERNLRSGQYNYPEEGWSTGQMRKVMDLQRRGQPDLGMLAEMEKAAGFGMAARGAAGGVGASVPQAAISMPIGKQAGAEVREAVGGSFLGTGWETDGMPEIDPATGLPRRKRMEAEAQ